jgi:hypothetical protein
LIILDSYQKYKLNIIMDKTDISSKKFDTKFFERYARISLMDLIDQRYSFLHNSDRPDLQDNENSVGVEVTRAIRESKDVANALVNKIAGATIMDVSESDWDDITKHGYGYGLNPNIVGKLEYKYWAAAYPLKRIIENKIKKVTEGYYGTFSHYSLYVFLKESLDRNTVTSTIKYVSRLQENKKYVYNYLFLSQINEMYICDLYNSSFKLIEISKVQCRRFYHDAINNNR